jgi:quercetin dioxygenase-like cupin family protein
MTDESERPGRIMNRNEQQGDASAGTGEIVSLAELALAVSHDGPAWSQATDDLNVNLVVLRAGHSIAEHINSEVDVLLVGIEGGGRVTIDGQGSELSAGQLVIIPKGAARSISPHGARFAYLTCHKRRAGLWPSTTPS